MKKLIIFAAISILVLFFLFCGKKDDTKEFQNFLNNMIKYANEKNLEKFMSSFSINYKDSSGVNYLYIKKLTQNSFNDFDSYETYYEDLNLIRSKKTDSTEIVELNFDIIVTGIKDGVPTAELIGSSGHLENITLTLKRNEFRKWKIIKIEGIKNKNYLE